MNTTPQGSVDPRYGGIVIDVKSALTPQQEKRAAELWRLTQIAMGNASPDDGRHGWPPPPPRPEGCP